MLESYLLSRIASLSKQRDKANQTIQAAHKTAVWNWKDNTMSNNDPIVIVGQARTPMGGFMGALSSVKTPELGASAIKAAVERAGLKG